MDNQNLDMYLTSLGLDLNSLKQSKEIKLKFGQEHASTSFSWYDFLKDYAPVQQKCFNPNAMISNFFFRPCDYGGIISDLHSRELTAFFKENPSRFETVYTRKLFGKREHQEPARELLLFEDENLSLLGQGHEVQLHDTGKRIINYPIQYTGLSGTCEMQTRSYWKNIDFKPAMASLARPKGFDITFADYAGRINTFNDATSFEIHPLNQDKKDHRKIVLSDNLNEAEGMGAVYISEASVSVPTVMQTPVGRIPDELIPKFWDSLIELDPITLEDWLGMAQFAINNGFKETQRGTIATKNFFYEAPRMV